VVEAIALPIVSHRLCKIYRPLVQKLLCYSRAFPSRAHPDRVSLAELWRIVYHDIGRYHPLVHRLLYLWDRSPLPQNIPTLRARVERAASFTI